MGYFPIIIPSRKYCMALKRNVVTVAPVANVEAGTFSKQSGTISAKLIQIMQPAANPAKKGKRAEKNCTKMNAGTANPDWGSAVMIHQIVSSFAPIPLEARMVAVAIPSGMLCKAMASVISKPLGNPSGPA